MTIVCSGPVLESSGVGLGAALILVGIIERIFPISIVGAILLVVSAKLQHRYYKQELENHWRYKKAGLCGPRCVVCEELAKKKKRTRRSR